jgi:translation initiation factor 2B subunit (eIF-2B alpha/beta/delta family)
MAAVWNAAHAPDPTRFLKELQTGWRRAARAARRLLPRRGTIVTLSYSATVLESLRGIRGRVVVAESLPGGEGARTAARLRAARTAATVVPDATLSQWAATADAVVLGADAVTRRGVINKVGSRLLALAARAERTPCYVIADTSKFALRTSRFPLPVLGADDLFEYVEFGLIRRVVTERGPLTGPQVLRRLRAPF